MAEPAERAADAVKPRRRRPSGRVRVAAIAAVLAVLVVAGGVAWVTNNHAARAADVAGHGSSPSTATSVTPTDVPDGWRLVSNEGLEFAIPKSWPLISIGCDVPTRSTLIVTGGAGPSCGWIEPPKVTIVQVGDLDAATFKALFDDTTESNVKTRAIGVSGEPATERTSTLSDGRTRVALTVPSRRATLIAAGPDPALLARIVGSARVFDVDVNGCTWQVPKPPSWDRVDSAKAIEVGQPTSVTVCNYAGTLVTSDTLRGSEAAALVTALRNARPGQSPDSPPSDCLDRGQRTVELRIVLHRTGGDLPVDGYFSRCTDRYVASPTGVSQMTQSILRAALTPLHLGWAFSAPLPEA